MSKEEIKPGDKILYPSPYARNPGPFKVLKVDKDGIIRVLRRSKNGKATTRTSKKPSGNLTGASESWKPCWKLQSETRTSLNSGSPKP